MAPQIKCKKCNEVFEPNIKTKGAWQCPSCQEMNPNLQRHYESVAVVYGMGLALTLIFALLIISENGWNVGVYIDFAYCLLIVVTIIFVFKSKEPWTDSAAKALIWAVLCTYFLLSVAIPMFINPVFALGRLIIVMIILSYLIWLSIQSNKCTVPTAQSSSIREIE